MSALSSRVPRLLLLLTGLAVQPIAVARAYHKPPTSLPESLVPGQAVIRAIWKEGILFIFEGKAGEVVTVTVTSKTPGLDPHITLVDPEKHPEASDDDGGGHGNSLIKNHMLKKSGRYTVRVGATGSDEGKVEVLLSKAKARGGR
jgi:hypothetical protein